jgi:hypothetical protein
LLGRVVSRLESLALSKDAQHRWVGVGYPSPEDETANEDDSPGEQAFEKIENSHCADAHKVENSPLDAQVREGLV